MFLLDTSAISALTNRSHARHTNAVAFKDQHVGQEQRLFVCVISLAEMQFGLNMYEMRAPRPSEADLDALRKHIQAAGSLSEPLEVTHHVATEQGRMRSKWACKLAPRKAAQGKASSREFPLSNGAMIGRPARFKSQRTTYGSQRWHSRTISRW